ncbi:MAG TPA: hypothetical protein VLY04_03970 [Bryobacteraceae bacterium]|nr:hypothetical protein [Bryobacteraceae bacterium]
MRLQSTVLGLSLVFLAAGAGFAREPKQRTDIALRLIYEGGGLPLQHHKVKATVGASEVVIAQRSRRIVVPVKSITEISCSAAMHRRMGAAALDIVPLMHLGETESRYVGVSWAGDGTTAGRPVKVEVLFKVGKSEYQEFLAALERSTGLKAVDTRQVPTVVQYE